MKDIVREDILSIFDDAIDAIKNNDAHKLGEISNHTVHDASIYQDKYSVSIAVIIYSLSKIFQRNQYKTFEGWKRFYKRCLENLDKARSALLRRKSKVYDNKLKDLYKSISELEHKLGTYITEVLNQAQIKKGKKVYEHGLSAGRAAELLGISKWELMNYLGQTKIADVQPLRTKNIKAKLEFTKKLFRE
ncbi:MAG: hypothetical protein ISS23_00835 [Nanoarchaeota archaeon]|nr:hypothetical protein [Nanoarchaeota archaeon]